MGVLGSRFRSSEFGVIVQRSKRNAQFVLSEADMCLLAFSEFDVQFNKFLSPVSTRPELDDGYIMNYNS